MNEVTLQGVVARTPYVKETSNGSQIARMNICVDGSYINQMGERKRSYPAILAFGKCAGIVASLDAGDEVKIEGEIQTGSYTKDGRTIYTTDVLSHYVELIRKAAASASSDAS